MRASFCSQQRLVTLRFVWDSPCDPTTQEHWSPTPVQVSWLLQRPQQVQFPQTGQGTSEHTSLVVVLLKKSLSIVWFRHFWLFQVFSCSRVWEVFLWWNVTLAPLWPAFDFFSYEEWVRVCRWWSRHRLFLRCCQRTFSKWESKTPSFSSFCLALLFIPLFLFKYDCIKDCCISELSWLHASIGLW